MEPQLIINLVLGAAMSVLGWFARELWDAMKELKQDLNRMREDLPKNYVTKEDWRHDLKEIKDILGKIFDKLDEKVNRNER